ncbi:hypothetical protein D9757_009076 [Collybiopsis confluens]|uniref:Major facilitator superfamily (MFS) profile domain-containing protein n=1 Tax=Collybiopsis confluens TaxID=2823264 RepID=A0A8H5M5G4_9AGAR|nr:hypothetical protein D9757_009076 [Collybiopsis confluens]
MLAPTSTNPMSEEPSPSPFVSNWYLFTGSSESGSVPSQDVCWRVSGPPRGAGELFRMCRYPVGLLRRKFFLRTLNARWKIQAQASSFILPSKCEFVYERRSGSCNDYLASIKARTASHVLSVKPMAPSSKNPSSIELAALPNNPFAPGDNRQNFQNYTSPPSTPLDEVGAPTFPLTSTPSRTPILGREPENAVFLPPMDRGFHAWAYLASAWCMTLLTWYESALYNISVKTNASNVRSLPFSYGIFLNFYASDPDFRHYPSSSLALVGSLCNGILYLSSPIVLPIINRYPWHKRNTMILGAILCVGGLVGAAFARTFVHLIITQGIMFSVGGSLVYYPMSTYLFEWFWAKKGIANGVVFSGTGVGGIVIPFVVENLLEKYGRRVALLSLAVAFLVLTIPCLPFVKPRVPVAQVVDVRSINTRFLTYTFYLRYIFPVFLVFSLLRITDPDLPFLAFASDLNLTTTSGTLAISLFNGSTAIGLIFLGWLSDYLDVRWAILISSLGSAISVFFIWGFAKSLTPLLAFACVYGFLGPAWSALWPRFVVMSDKDDLDPRQASTLMGIFIAGRGIGSVLSAPIASGLLSHSWSLKGNSPSIYGFQGYGPLIAFTGVTLLSSSLGTGYRLLDKTRRTHHITGEI